MALARSVLIGAVALTLGALGCASRQDTGERIVCMAKPNPVGARIRVSASSRIGPFLEPGLYVVKSLHGTGGRYCPPDRFVARVIPESLAMVKEEAARQKEDKAREEFRGVAKISPGDAFPAGALHLAAHTVRRLGPDAAAAWLVVNFDKANDKGEQSYVADTTADCAKGTLSVAWWTTFSGANGAGQALNSGSSNAAIDKPSPALAAALRAICEPRS